MSNVESIVGTQKVIVQNLEQRVVVNPTTQAIRIEPAEQKISVILAGPQGPRGEPGVDADASIAAHVNAAEPHPPYDDMVDLSLIFENGLV